MEIKVLGACCKKSQQMFENTKEAVVKLGIDVKVENIGDDMEIMSYGVMSTPALVVDGKVLTTGKLYTADEICKLLTNNNPTGSNGCSCGGCC